MAGTRRIAALILVDYGSDDATVDWSQIAIRDAALPIPHDVLQRVLDSIEGRNLVVLCGAGLSMAPPTGLMSAVDVSRRCYDRYAPTRTLPTDFRDDVDKLAGHFFAGGQFETLFLDRLVPWDDLVGEPNAGHAAVSDLLLSGAAFAALSANFDPLIEQWAMQRKVALQGALDGVEAARFAQVSAPLLKFHGCLSRRRRETIWTQAQLAVTEVARKITSLTSWMDVNLPGKDFLIVGFWTDWGYLNEVLARALASGPPRSVTVLDRSTTAVLEAKAPALWAMLSSSSRFEHVEVSGEGALAEIRAAFSLVWARKLHARGRPLYEAEKGPCPATRLEPPHLTEAAAYDHQR